MGAEREGWVLAWRPWRGDGGPAELEIAPTPDPLGEIVLQGLDPGMSAPRRWAAARDGATARELLLAAEAAGARLAIATGDAELDAVVAGIAPVLPALLDDLSPRQREIARLFLVDGLRQAEIGRRLGVSRPTVSVAVGRGHLREIAGLARALRILLARGRDAPPPPDDQGSHARAVHPLTSR